MLQKQTVTPTGQLNRRLFRGTNAPDRLTEAADWGTFEDHGTLREIARFSVSTIAFPVIMTTPHGAGNRGHDSGLRRIAKFESNDLSCGQGGGTAGCQRVLLDQDN